MAPTPTASIYVAGYMTLLQAWIYDYFEGAGGLLWDDYKSEMPRACKLTYKNNITFFISLFSQIFSIIYVAASPPCYLVGSLQPVRCLVSTRQISLVRFAVRVVQKRSSADLGFLL
ncbi:hypothetical protein QL285_074621 [Trifolium repens]|nr:hypothetical protein QL285_074621 [Trifolium repens]